MGGSVHDKALIEKIVANGFKMMNKKSNDVKTINHIKLLENIFNLFFIRTDVEYILGYYDSGKIVINLACYFPCYLLVGPFIQQEGRE